MTVEHMRKEIAWVYDGQKWKDRVANMHEGQVIAIYKSFESTGKFEEARRKKERDGVQLRMNLEELR